MELGIITKYSTIICSEHLLSQHRLSIQHRHETFSANATVSKKTITKQRIEALLRHYPKSINYFESINTSKEVLKRAGNETIVILPYFTQLLGCNVALQKSNQGVNHIFPFKIHSLYIYVLSKFSSNSYSFNDWTITLCTNIKAKGKCKSLIAIIQHFMYVLIIPKHLRTFWKVWQD